MSRELLKRMRDVLRGLEETHYDLYWDIQTALEQNEQEEPEQVPVAWMSTKGEGGLTDDSYYANHKDYVPLYTAQKREPAQTAREMYQRGYAKAKDDLKREPLSDKDITEERLQVPIGIWHFKSFEAGIKYAEKAHGIGVNDD